MPSATPSRSTRPNLGCGYVVCAVLFVAGVGLMWAVKSKHSSRRTMETSLGLTFGALMCAAGAGLIGPMRREVARAQERERREAKRPNEPWTWEPAWTDAAGIRQAPRRHARALAIFGVAALALSLPATVVQLPQEIAKGNYTALLLLIFPLVGASLLGGAGLEYLRRRKYGHARFVAEQVPFRIRGEVAGMVVVDRPVQASGDGRAVLECWRSTLTRAHNRRRQTDEIVSQTERVVAREDWRATGQDSQLFVQLAVRGGSPSTMSALAPDSPTYEWRLRIEAPTAGADFKAEFTLPVFDVRGQENDGESAKRVDSSHVAPAVALRDRAEVWRAAGISEEAKAGAVDGHALAFPAKVGRRFLLPPALMGLFLGGIALAIWVGDGPTFVGIIFGVFALLPAMMLPLLWSGGGEKIWVETDEICVQLEGGRERRVRIGEVLKIEMKASVGAGTQQFYRIVAQLRPNREGRFGRRVRLASLVRGDEAAAQAVAWLEERMTRPAS